MFSKENLNIDMVVILKKSFNNGDVEFKFLISSKEFTNLCIKKLISS